ncbi:MAG: SAM-dependent methyltransferase [Archangium sp.]|nr:SAM-dependent methyltransferase [Archangium sp.]
MLNVRVVVVLLLSGCVHRIEPLSLASVQALVSAPDRTEADRALDPGRKPAEFLQFLGVGPGMHVADLMAGGGYTTELLSRAVGPNGVVYGENPKLILERFAEKPWSERLTRLPNAKRLDRELGDPFPAELERTLDVVVSNAIYHDSVWLQVDRLQMNQAVYHALKMGGAYVVCDSSAKAGTGVGDVQVLHRIDEQVVRDEVTKAGFKLEASGEFLRNPEDTRDWSASPGAAGEKRGTSDRFCLRFVRPTVYY